MKVLIKNVLVLDVYEDREIKRDVYVQDGIITSPFEDPDIVIDGDGKYLIPGLIDMHVHLREPGREDEETIESGTKAAIHGGITGVCSMPNTDPVIDSPELVKYVIEKSEDAGNAMVFPIGAITKKQKGEEITEMFLMKEAGAVGFSDDGLWVKNSGVMRRALEYSLLIDAPIISHCEDTDLSLQGDMNEGFLSFKLGLKGIPRESETIAIFRDISLAQLTGGRLHIAHVSTKEGVELIKYAKEMGLSVTSEVTVNHLYFSEEVLKDYDTVFKVNPPLRTPEDREALIRAVEKNIIDVIVTDHAPHSIEEKESEFSLAPPGIMGLETAFYVLYEIFILSGRLSLLELIKKMTINPAKIIGIENWGRVDEGFMANFLFCVVAQLFSLF